VLAIINIPPSIKIFKEKPNMMRTHRIFISHAWQYGDAYDRLVVLLNKARYFSYINYSAPEDRPLDLPSTVTKAKIEKALDNKIKPVHIVLVISGMYYNHRDWIQYEVDTAAEYGKPIIAVEPWGSERFPSQLEPYVLERVKWNTDSIVDAVRRHSLA
jgi:hypothetical protein